MRSNFEPGRVHLRTVRAVPAERLVEEKTRMRSLPAGGMPDLDRRQVVRVPAQPLVRVDRNDYSIDPRFVGRRVELRASQTEVTAVVLDTGELAASIAGCSPADSRSPTRRIRPSLSVSARSAGARRDQVEIRPLARYDALIGAS